MLKKQTVWLLTMLSLIIVLSVYYITSPEQSAMDDLAYVEDQDAQKEKDETNAVNQMENVENAETSAGESQTVVSSVASDELFTALRMQLEEQRAELKENLDEVIASDVSAEVKNEAHTKMVALNELEQKESLLETVLRTEGGYSDVLINTIDDQVQIIVKAEKSSNKEANTIMQTARDYLGEKNISVKFQIAN
ncbi:SpoIIIAH-like family protein [Bacillus taeanensis]|uniref:SpoIIIAH-like family protein n=1 Tax=Bacillus taeanensis TaxID=273032 RepID=A0A366XYF8_9BACI|nr:SpoIIIAH-like family protein [Bacillus taeanensis]RBW70656.1 SpoIIIAH-like family protein [Bacillus taeanensis]